MDNHVILYLVVVVVLAIIAGVMGCKRGGLPIMEPANEDLLMSNVDLAAAIQSTSFMLRSESPLKEILELHLEKLLFVQEKRAQFYKEV